jgi:serine phosphatase RsbU (regulator of sigma subunit)
MMLNLPKGLSKHIILFLAMLLLTMHITSYSQQLQLRPLSETNQDRVSRAEELVSYYTNQGDFNTAIIYLNQISYIYWQNQRPDKAAESFQRAANYYERLGDFVNLQKIYSNIGLIFLDLEDLPNADRAFIGGLDASRRTGEHRIIATALVDLAYVKTLRKENREAIRLLEESMNIALEHNFEQMLPNIYQQLSRNYRTIGNTRQGDEYGKKYNDIREYLARQTMRGEFQEREQRSQVQILQAQAEARERELQIQIQEIKFQQEQDSITLIVRATEDSLELVRQREEIQRANIVMLEQDAQLQEAEIERQKAIQNQQRTVIYAALMGAVLLFFLIIIMYSSNKAKQKANKELAEKNEEIQLTSEQLRGAFDKIEDQNIRITQSISYAKEIQKALFPPEITLNNFLPESFIFFKPVDMVSGDFYWFREIVNQQKGEKVKSEQLVAVENNPGSTETITNGYYNFKNDKFIVSAVDCTGHGVPGAFMSMIGYNLLDSITQSGTTHPDRILNRLHMGVRRTLKQDEGNNRDGMDLSVCVIDRKQKTIEFAGANNPLVYIKDDEVSVIKGDRYSIGGIQKEAERRFTPHTIKVDKPTCFYIFSDGYTDQFGGEKGRSFLLKNFKELLLSIHKEPMEKQRQMLADHFMEWKGNEDQIDDVIVIGFKLG